MRINSQNASRDLNISRTRENTKGLGPVRRQFRLLSPYSPSDVSFVSNKEYTIQYNNSKIVRNNDKHRCSETTKQKLLVLIKNLVELPTPIYNAGFISVTP